MGRHWRDGFRHPKAGVITTDLTLPVASQRAMPGLGQLDHEMGAALMEALVGEGVVELRLGDGACRGQLAVAVDPALDDVDLLVELTLALAHVGDVHGLDRWRHVGQDVSALHLGSKPGEQAG